MGFAALGGNVQIPGRGAVVAMMEAADLRYGDHPPFGRVLDSTWHRSVAFQQETSA